MQRYLVAAALAACCPPPAAKLPQTAVGSATGAPPSVGTPINAGAPAIGGDTLDTLVADEKLHGFTVGAVYLDDADKPIGARFVHDQTGFTLDYLRIESAPQGYIWVDTYPTSDKGEPHTQEHLLLGKGDRGRKLGSFEAMALAESSAFTEQWHTAYHFHTVAGNDVFWPVFENQLDAAINPDYTDEEIRREVRNFGVDKGDDGKLHLEEKGTVYNEMVRDYETPAVRAWRAAKQAVYGAQHPLALESGGEPSAIRTMTPADIRAFHDANYHLANMGLIGAFPSAVALTGVLDHTAAILAKEAGRKGHVVTELPKPAPAPAGALRVVEYPYADTANPGPMLFVWPATRHLDDTERLLLGLFLDSVAGDDSTPLYKLLIDGKTRTLDLGASGMNSFLATDLGQPAYIGVEGVRPDKLDDKTLGEVRALIVGEIARIAKLPDGDAELAAFDRRVHSRVVELRRSYTKFLDTPPGFGTRRTGSGWFDHLHELAKTKGFKKSLTMRPELDAIEHILAGATNPWRERVKAWGLGELPYGVAARPSPALRKALDAERDKRIADELARLRQHYGTADAAATLARAQTDYDAATKQLEASAKAVDLPPLVASPPMTLDDNIKYETGELAATRTFTAMFDSMTSVRVSLAFSLAGAVSSDDEMFLAALPALLDDVGVIDNGTPIASADMKDRLRKDVLELSVAYTGNARTHRRELQISGAGNGTAETKAAFAWMRRVLFAPDWRIDNLPRLRDVVDQQLTALRQTMLGEEEFWVDGPRDTWWEQSTLQAHTASFLTRIHDLHRLRWMLLDPRDAKVTAEVARWLATLAGTKLPRAQLVELARKLAAGDEPSARKLSPAAQPFARAAGKDLGLALGDIPDESLAADWSYLCKQMAKDLAFGAPAALAKLAEVRAQIVQGQRARLVEVGSSANITALAADVETLVRALPVPQIAHAFGAELGLGGPFRRRLADRVHAAKPPQFVGLVAPSTSSGVFLNLAPASAYANAADDAVLDYLASNLYTGHGAHSMFMKTWAAGLAYSNGLHPHPDDGTLDYYAERCPLLPQTLRFVIDELRKQQPDANIARYAIAKAFDSRIAANYEARAARMAADLADELPPDIVRAFRSHVLAQSGRADLAHVLFARMLGVYAKVLPGLGKLAPDATYFVIGNAKQLAAYQDYLHAAVGKDATLWKLYPRDFWIPAKLTP
jgi:Zn-dependent M16 (insulinase) family peptidase